MTPSARGFTRIARECLGTLIVFFASGPAIAQVSFSISPDMAFSQQIVPGATGHLILTAHNEEATSSLAGISGIVFSNADVFSEYVFVADQPALCNQPALATDEYGTDVQFSGGPIEPGADLTCDYTMMRSMSSRNDLVFSLCRPGDFIDCIFRPFSFGTLPDLSLRADAIAPVSIGSLEATFRVTAFNPSPNAVAATSIGTDCAEFFVGGMLTAPFDIDNDFPDACPTSEESLPCANFTGQDATSKGFRIGPIPANGTASCLLRAHFWQPLSQPLSFGLQYVGPFAMYVLGGAGYDSDTLNDRGVMQASPSANGDAPMGVPIGYMTYALLTALIGAMGLLSAGKSRMN